MQAQDRAQGDAIARTRFTDEGDDFAALDGEGDAINGLDGSFPPGKSHGEVANINKGSFCCFDCFDCFDCFGCGIHTVGTLAKVACV